MSKRLNSENRFNINGFKAKVGTTNRLTPTTVYIDLGGYITPQEDEESYEENINQIDKDFKKKLKYTLNNKNIFDKKCICVLETAHERMKKGKSSYISLQCHLKQNSNLDSEKIIRETEILTNEIVNDFSKIANDYGFSIKK